MSNVLSNVWGLSGSWSESNPNVKASAWYVQGPIQRQSDHWVMSHLWRLMDFPLLCSLSSVGEGRADKVIYLHLSTSCNGWHIHLSLKLHHLTAAPPSHTQRCAKEVKHTFCTENSKNRLSLQFLFKSCRGVGTWHLTIWSCYTTGVQKRKNN